jgi:hypothetical protein
MQLCDVRLGLAGRLIYHAPNGKRDLQAYGTNLLDKFYRLTV